MDVAFFSRTQLMDVAIVIKINIVIMEPHVLVNSTYHAYFKEKEIQFLSPLYFL